MILIIFQSCYTDVLMKINILFRFLGFFLILEIKIINCMNINNVIHNTTTAHFHNVVFIQKLLICLI